MHNGSNKNKSLTKANSLSGWDKYSIDIIKPLLNKRSKVLDLIRQNKFSESQAKGTATETRLNFTYGINLAKSKLSNYLSDRKKLFFSEF